MLMGDTNNNEIQRCHLRATCYNSIGSYRCTCIQGFSGDGFDCSGNRFKFRSSDCNFEISFRFLFFCFCFLLWFKSHFLILDNVLSVFMELLIYIHCTNVLVQTCSTG